MVEIHLLLFVEPRLTDTQALLLTAIQQEEDLPIVDEVVVVEGKAVDTAQQMQLVLGIIGKAHLIT